MSSRELFKTDNMSLAAFLHMSRPIVRTEWRGRTCSWLFEKADGMQSQIDEFLRGDARVDPVQYNDSYSKLKTESFYEGVWETGRVVMFHDEKGYGFVKRDDAYDGEPDILFRVEYFKTDGSNLRVVVGDAVEFVVMNSPKGERCKVIRLADLRQDTA